MLIIDGSSSRDYHQTLMMSLKKLMADSFTGSKFLKASGWNLQRVDKIISRFFVQRAAAAQLLVDGWLLLPLIFLLNAKSAILFFQTLRLLTFPMVSLTIRRMLTASWKWLFWHRDTFTDWRTKRLQILMTSQITSKLPWKMTCIRLTTDIIAVRV